MDSPFLTVTEPLDMISLILMMSEEELLNLWAGLKESERSSRVSVMEEAASLLGQTSAQTLRKAVSDQRLLISPLTRFILIEEMARVRSRDQLVKKMRSFNLPPSDFKLSALKPYAVNYLDALQKIYLLYTYSDAYIYAQVARVCRVNNLQPTKDSVAALTVAHASVTMLMRWYRLASLMDEQTFFLGADEQELATNEKLAQTLPPPELVISTVSTTIKALEEVKVFPRVMMKMLRDQPDLTNFYLILDALLMIAREKKMQDEHNVRKRVAYLNILYDVINQNVGWYQYFGNTASHELLR